jgi:hypothetical protein
VDAFKPEAEAAADKNPALQKLTVKPEGKTDQESLVWSGDTLMDLQKLQVLKMTIEKVGNQDYLFIESGGFDKKNSTDWKSLYTVMKRK